MKGHTGTYIFIVLVAALEVFNMRSQVRVDDAEAGVVENEPHCHTSFVSLQQKMLSLKYKDSVVMSKH